MNQKMKKNIDGFVEKKIILAGTLSEIKELLFFFELISHREYCKLAGLVNQVYAIDGLENAPEGVYRLHYHLSRRFKLSSLYIGKRINFNDPKALNYLFNRIGSEIHKKLDCLREIYDSNIIKNHNELLAKFIEKLNIRQNKLIFSDHKKIEIKKLVTSYLEEKKQKDSLTDELANELYNNQEIYKKEFISESSPQDIASARDYYLILTNTDLIDERIKAAKRSCFANKGADPHIQPGTYAAVITNLIAISENLLITAFIEWVVPKIPFIGDRNVTPFLAATLAIIPIMTSIYLFPYFSHRQEKNELTQKRTLILNLAEQIPEYQSRLAKKGFDLSPLHKQDLASSDTKMSETQKKGNQAKKLAGSRMSGKRKMQRSYKLKAHR